MKSRPPMPPEALLEHRDFVRRLARRLVVDESLADDVAQQTWLAALTRPPRDEGVRAWLRQVVRRLAMRHHRGESRRLRRETTCARDEVGSTDLADDLAHHEVMREVTDAVLRLSPPYREVVMSHFYRGLSADEIARHANIPRATVYTRLRRALTILRADLERQLGGPEEWRGALAGLAALPLTHVVSRGAAVRESSATATHGPIAHGLATPPTSVVWIAAVVVTVGFGIWFLRDATRADDRSTPTPPRATTLASDRDGSTFAVARTASPRAPFLVASRSRSDDRMNVAPSLSTGSAPAASVSIRIVWEDTREPVADRGLRVVVAPHPRCPGTDAPASRFRTRIVELRSDADGLVELRDVAPGVLRFVDDVGPYDLVDGTLTLEVASGDNVEHELRLPRGRTVEGRVVDRDDQPIAGASVWTSDYYNRRNGRIVATTDSAGSFVIRGVSDGRWIAAHAPAFAPSRLIRLGGLAGETLRPRIVLDRGGASLYGTVTDSAGRAVADARIDVASVDEPCAVDRFGTELSNRLVRTTRTDADGAFRISSIAAGTCTVSILASELAPQRRVVTFGAAEDVPIAIVLEAAVTVRGVVRDAEGRPVESAQVTTRSPDSFGFRLAETNSAGAYALGGLAPATVLRYRHEQLGTAEAPVDAAPGDHVELDVTLDRGTTLGGCVVDADGGPLPAMLVRARGSRPDPATGFLWSAEATTTDDGTFLIVAVPSEAVDLTVSDPQDRERALGYSRLDAGDSSSGAIRVAPIVIDRTEAGTGIVRGRAVRTDGAPVPARLTLRADPTPFTESAKTELDGAFSIPNVTPGTYRLVAEADGVPAFSLGDVAVHAGRTADLGTIVLDTPGTLSVDVAGHADLGPYESVRVTTGGRAIRFEAGLRENLVVWPGLLRVTLVGRAAATETFEVEVRPGESIRRSVVPRRGVPCRFEIALPQDDPPHILGVALHDVRGIVSYDAISLASPTPPVVEYRLLPGDYRLVVSEPRDDGITIPFTVRDTATEWTQRIEYPAR